MPTITSLSISLPYGELNNTFFRPDIPQGRLAVLFPGRGYTCAMPLLYYPARWLVSRGADVLTIEYACIRQPGYDLLPAEEKQRRLSAEVDAAVQAALLQGQYGEMVYVGKSLGTLALSHLAAHSPFAGKTSYVWLTPLVQQSLLRRAVQQAAPRSLFISGTADPLYDPVFFKEVLNTSHGEGLLLPDADHALEIPGDLPATLDALRLTLDAITAFIPW